MFESNRIPGLSSYREIDPPRKVFDIYCSAVTQLKETELEEKYLEISAEIVCRLQPFIIPALENALPFNYDGPLNSIVVITMLQPQQHQKQPQQVATAVIKSRKEKNSFQLLFIGVQETLQFPFAISSLLNWMSCVFYANEQSNRPFSLVIKFGEYLTENFDGILFIKLSLLIHF